MYTHTDFAVFEDKNAGIKIESEFIVCPVSITPEDKTSLIKPNNND